METIRWTGAGLVLIIAIYMMVLGFVRQVHNLRESRNENGKWSSPTPIIGTATFLGAWVLVPTSLPSWGFLFLLLDLDTLILLISLPMALLANENK